MTTPNHHWYHLTPYRFFIGLLAVQVFLFLSERFRWFPFNEYKGWTVLIAVGVVGVAVVVMLVWALVYLLLLRRFQFSFRSLLVFLVVVSIPLGWFAWEMQKAKRQREAVEAIVNSGAEVSYDYEVSEEGAASGPTWLRKLLGEHFFCEAVRVVCRNTEFGDSDARHLQELTNLEWLALNRAQITDSGLEHLKGLTKLEELSLNGTQITDDGLERLKGMTELRNLHLGDTQITDRGLRHLKGMTRLTRLSLHGTQISDTGLAELKSMTSLQALEINHTQITDAGLEHVKGMTEISSVWLEGTNVTDQGGQKFRQALPNCHIIR